MTTRGRAEVTAGFWLAATLFALEIGRSGAPAGDRLRACPHPGEIEARGGHTLRVDCDVRGGLPLRGPARVLFGLGLDPNSADASTLEALPGVGLARAQAIVAERERGAYRSLADLGRVPGIGPVTLRRAAPWLVFSGDHPEAP